MLITNFFNHLRAVQRCFSAPKKKMEILNSNMQEMSRIQTLFQKQHRILTAEQPTHLHKVDAFIPAKFLQKPAPMDEQMFQVLSHLQLQRECIQKENQELFTSLMRKGYFMARQISPLVLETRVAEKQKELADLRQLLQQTIQSTCQQHVEITNRLTKDDALKNEVELALIDLEKLIHQYQENHTMSLKTQDISFTLLLNDMERLNKLKNVLKSCQKGGFNSAFEWDQLLKDYENEYQQLIQKCSDTQECIDQLEHKMVFLTDHLMGIAKSLNIQKLQEKISKISRQMKLTNAR